jgi:hypothetical protein
METQLDPFHGASQWGFAMSDFVFCVCDLTVGLQPPKLETLDFYDVEPA